MELKNACIYNHILEYVDEIETVTYKKGQYLTRSNHDFTGIFFILEGTVQVEYTTKSGKRFLVDELSANEFVGKISYLYDQSLYCDIIAITDAVLLKINKYTFSRLQNNQGFLNLFLFKNSKRIYSIYKKLMMKELFSAEELVSFYILENCQDNIFRFKSMYSLCKSLSISRKNVYNILNKFIDKKYVRKDNNSLIILNKDSLCEISRDVKEFNETNASDFKLVTINN